MRSLDILYVGTLPPHPGGSAVSGSQIVVGLARLGHRVRALAPMTNDARTGGDPFAEAHPELNVTRFLVPHFETAPHRPSSDEYGRLEEARIREALDGLIRTRRPDIFFVGRESFAHYIPGIARALSIPCVVRMAGSATLGMVSGTYRGDQAERLLQQLRRADLLITPAHHLAQSVRRLGLEHVRAIPNAVDVQTFAPRPKDERLLRALDLSTDDVVVMHVSNLKDIKRPLDIVGSAGLTLPRDPRLAYVIVGDGDRRKAMEDACAGPGVAGRFRFTGWVDYARMPDYVNLADVMVMPSEYEAMARVYLETQACARLLLASDVPGAREVIVHGDTGLLFGVGDVEELAVQTLHAAGDPELRTEIGRAARRQVESHAIGSALAAYEAALREVIDRRQTRGREVDRRRST